MEVTRPIRAIPPHGRLQLPGGTRQLSCRIGKFDGKPRSKHPALPRAGLEAPAHSRVAGEGNGLGR